MIDITAVKRKPHVECGINTAMKLKSKKLMCHSIKSLNHKIHHITLVYKVKSAQQQVSIFKDIIKIAL